MAGIYIHIPFCIRKCIYCDFYSVGARCADWETYVDALLREASQRLCINKEEVRTIYIGGGTPSLMPDVQFRKLVSGLKSIMNSGWDTILEFTIEVNPDDVSDQKAQTWCDCGVNRISMGVQSLNDSELKLIGRRHDAAKAKNAYQILRKYFDNISLDLIFGLPGQSVQSLEATVRGLIELRPEHISAYSLMYEERTALTRMRDAGMLQEADDVDSEKMFQLITSLLKESGYKRYEISNYALPGRESRHNSSYWRGDAYIGLGSGAHSYDGDRIRGANLSDFKSYINFWLHNKDDKNLIMPYEEEELSKDELREEMIMTSLRTSEGLDLEKFAVRFGVERKEELLKSAKKFINSTQPKLVVKDNRLILTEIGVMISDDIISSIF